MADAMGWTELLSGLDFGEGPRWRDGRLWFSDFYKKQVATVDLAGNHRIVHGDLDDHPSGLGWLPDGSLLVVAMNRRALWREEDGRLVDHADLSQIARGPCNDMVVDAEGNAYVGNFGFDLYAGEGFSPADLALVRADGSVETAASGLMFPNGSVITADGSTLVVGETFGGRYTAFPIADDKTLGPGRVWAEAAGTAPDGCALDAEGAIWFADATGSELLRVTEGGEILERRPTPIPAFACMLGGDDGRTLFALCAAGYEPHRADGTATGVIFTSRVEAGHAGCP
jgi:sugar lactone lactonase YvrE